MYYVNYVKIGGKVWLFPILSSSYTPLFSQCASHTMADALTGTINPSHTFEHSNILIKIKLKPFQYVTLGPGRWIGKTSVR